VNTHIYSFTFIHLADAFIQSDLQLLYMSEVAHLWTKLGVKCLAQGHIGVSQWI